MVDTSLVIFVGKHLSDVVCCKFALACLLQHANRGQVSQDPALSMVSIISWGLDGPLSTQELRCRSAFSCKCVNAQWVLVAGKSVEEGEVNAETGSGYLKVLRSQTLGEMKQSMFCLTEF